MLDPDCLGIPASIHATVFEKECEALHAKQRIDAVRIPEILEVLNAPGVVEACNQLLGKHWAIVPFTHNTPFLSGSNDQHWHKDDNGPYNSRKARHHHAVQVEMLYYPQDVKADMGPTATVPYSQYWTFNHEENHDNFAGADHLDFSYQLSGMERIPISGPRSEYSTAEIVERRTPHDERMRSAVAELNWPLCKPFEVGPLKAGSVVLYSHNLLHRGNHRRDDWQTWRDKPRFMWRFWLYRTTEPETTGYSDPIDWEHTNVDPMTSVNLANLSSEVLAIWNYQANWMLGNEQSPRKSQPSATGNTPQLDALSKQLLAMGDQAEPSRIGAGYQLGELAQHPPALKKLATALHDERESVRRAAMFGLVAAGTVATPVFLDALQSASKWIRKAAVFGLGESGSLSPAVRKGLINLLLQDPSVYVRSVAAGGLGCFARRAIDTGVTEEIPSIASAFAQSLAKEPNRLSMDREQNRSIKFVRPNDQCDVCEGIGFDYGHERFKPVRSAVRENVLWSTVILCSHGPASLGTALKTLVDALANVVQTDQNLFCVGSAMDALARLAWITPDGIETIAQQRIRRLIPTVFATSPIRCDDALVRSGMPLADLQMSRKIDPDEAAQLPAYEVKR